MLISSVKDTVFDTPAPGTGTLAHHTGSLDNKGLPVVFRTKNSPRKFIQIPVFIQNSSKKNACS